MGDSDSPQKLPEQLWPKNSFVKLQGFWLAACRLPKSVETNFSNGLVWLTDLPFDSKANAFKKSRHLRFANIFEIWHAVSHGTHCISAWPCIIRGFKSDGNLRMELCSAPKLESMHFGHLIRVISLPFTLPQIPTASCVKIINKSLGVFISLYHDQVGMWIGLGRRRDMTHESKILTPGWAQFPSASCGVKTYGFSFCVAKNSVQHRQHD